MTKKQPPALVSFAGSLDDKEHFSEGDVAKLLATSSIELEHGQNYAGRPGTKIYHHDNKVLKVRTDVVLNSRNAQRWVAEQLEREKKIRVHHPSKTWLFIERESAIHPANLTPELDTLQSRMNRLSLDIKVKMLNDLFKLYFSAVVHHDKRLDDGLSNFGYGHNNKLYYIDDEFYKWDNAIAFSHSLVTYLRLNSDINLSAVTFIGKSLRNTILDMFHQDSHYLFVIAEQLGSIFVNDQQKRVVDALITQLQKIKTADSSKKRVKPIDENQPIAIIGDIHANQPALKAVLEDIKHKQIQTTYALGDIVGYGPNPAECIKLIQQAKILSIQGNHDHAIAHQSWQERFNQKARRSAEWTYNRLSSKEREWLASLPPIKKLDWGWLVHGAPMDPTFFNAYVYEMTYKKNLDFMEKSSLKLCFHGHTHMPKVYSRNRSAVDNIFTGREIALSSEDIKLICPGSVGQPRDGSAVAQYGIWNPKSQIFEYQFIKYDTDQFFTDMTKNGFPDVVKIYQEQVFNAQ